MSVHEKSAPEVTIFVRILEEATPCMQHTKAIQLSDGTYKILPTPNYNPADVIWEFPPGSIVRCEEFEMEGESILRAVEKVPSSKRNGGETIVNVFANTVELRDADGHLLWQIRSDQIALVGEYTTDEGPWGDDWFLVIATATSVPYFMTCSMYSEGREDFLAYLRTEFEVEPRLTRSTEWKSVVLWPKSIAGSELFEFSRRAPRNFWEQFRSWIDGSIRDARLSQAVNEFLQKNKRTQ